MRKSIGIIIILSVLLVTCKNHVLDNPVDPEADNFQGFPVYSSDVDLSDISFELPNISPVNLNSTSDTSPLISWDSLDGISEYQIVFTDDINQTLLATPITVTGPKYQIISGSPLSLDTTYYWMVKPVYIGEGQVPWSNIYNFTVSWDITYNGLNPSDGGNTTDSTPLLDWDDIIGAVDYEIRYASTEIALPSALIENLPISQYQYTPTLSNGDYVYWQVRAVNEDGVRSSWSENWSFVKDPEIGESYAGGVIFYLFGTGGGLVISGADQSSGILWSDSEPYMGGTSFVIGTGASNTTLIVGELGGGSYAASLCEDLDLAGYNDWYLPSRDELNIIFELKDIIGGLDDSYYWSSSEGLQTNTAWTQHFSTGQQRRVYKYSILGVRAIRTFN